VPCVDKVMDLEADVEVKGTALQDLSSEFEVRNAKLVTFPVS
jgi:hypothetical protein